MSSGGTELTPHACAAVALKDRSDDEMKWYLHLLASVVKRTGAAIVPHVDKLRAVIAECFASNKKGVAKEAGKLLISVLPTPPPRRQMRVIDRSVLFDPWLQLLHSLSQYYPTDYRSLPPTLWNSEGERAPNPSRLQSQTLVLTPPPLSCCRLRAIALEDVGQARRRPLTHCAVASAGTSPPSHSLVPSRLRPRN